MANRGAPAGDAARVAVLVAGMHRSGTSLLAQVLVGLGCDAPKTLMEADEHNPFGYWESTPIAALNDAILASAGSAWDDWERFNPHWSASPAAGEFQEQARALLESEYGGSRLFVLKDPRICRLLPFWCDVIRQFGAEPRVAIPLRNPFEVGESLAARDAISPSVGTLLWLRNVLDAEADSRQGKRAFAWYDDLLGNWEAVVGRLGGALDVHWPKRSTTVSVDIEERISPSLRHHAKGDALDDPAVSHWTRSVHAILSRTARGRSRQGDLAELDAIRAAFDEAAAVFGRPLLISTRLGKQNRALEGEVHARGEVIADREQQIDSLNQAVRDRDQEIASLTSVVRGKDEQIGTLDRAVADRDVRTDRLLHSVAERDGRLSASNETVRDRDRQIARLQKAVADNGDRANRLNAALTERQAQSIALKATLEEREAANERLRREVARVMADRDTRLADRDARIADRDARIAARDASLAEQNARMAEQAEQQNRLRREVAQREGRLFEREDLIRGLRAELAESRSRADDLAKRVVEGEATTRNLSASLDSVNAEVEAHAKIIADREGELQSMNRALGDRDAAIHALTTSTSWRVTKPLRALRLLFGGPATAPAKRGPRRAAGHFARHALRFLWRLLPLGTARKTRLKNRLAGRLGPRAARKLLSRAPAARDYTSCGRLDLADRNYEASRHNAPVPILFDADYYLANNDDVREAGGDPLAHYLAHGAVEGRLPIDIAAQEIDPLVRDLHRFDMEADDAAAFDPTFYRALYPDVAALDDDALALHYQQHGQAESRIGGKAGFLREVCANPREIPIDFSAEEYLGLYPDLADGFATGAPLEVLRHYMLHGRWEPRLHTLRGDEPHKTAAPLASTASPSHPPLCVLAHVYYPELWPELSGYLANLPPDCYHLYVNLVDTTFTQALLASVRADFPEARVHISRNIGRDIGGHFQTLRNLRMANYRVFCLAHTKKSPHMSQGEVQLWRRKLLGPLLGTPEAARDSLRLLLDDDAVGLVGSARCRYNQLNDNPQKYFELLDRLGVKDEAREVDFLSGTMMFVRREVLQRMFEATTDIDLEPGDDQPLAFHRDGQWAHAIERAFCALARDMNYRVEWR